jgi:2-methylcitrate dehydratase PrpD
MKRRRFLKTSARAGFGAGFALSTPSELFARFAPQQVSTSGAHATETLARFVSDFRYEHLPPRAVEAAKVAIIDGVGVMLAGATYQLLASVMAGYVREMGGTPRCSVVSWGFKTNAPFAAFANGVFGHCLDYEIQGFPPTHGTSACLPAALALGEETRASGKDVIAAYVLGWEVQGRLRAAGDGTGLGMSPGFHPPGVVGPMGGTVAAAKMLSLNAEQTRMALGIAASRAGGLTANTGTMMKSTHPGNAARMGVEAALLARAGYTSHPDILETANGYARALFSGGIDWDVVIGRFGTGFVPRIVEPGFDIKRFPAQISMQWLTESVLNLREAHAFRPEDVEYLTIESENGGTERPDPVSGLDGKFSPQYCAAAALLDGRVNIETFTDARRFSPDMEAMLRKVSLAPRNGNGARAVARLRDGRTVSAECVHFRGSAGNPFTREERVNKFRYCAGHALSDRDSERLLGLLERLEAVADVSTLMDLVRPRAGANR